MTIASTVIKIRADNKTERAFKQIDDDFGRLENGAISLTGKLAGLAGAAGMGLLIKNQMKLAKETQSWSDALGVNIETLSAWNYAAKEVNLEGDKMADIMKDVSEKIGDAFANNAGEAVDVMKRLNLNMADMAAMSPDQQLLAIANSLDQVGTRAEKIQILESMGSDLSKMLPLLDDNAAGLHKLMREAEDMGAVMSQSEADGLKAMNDTMRKIEASSTALSQSFVLAFGDKFVSAIDYINVTGLPALKFMAEELGLVKFAIEGLAEKELEARLGSIIKQIETLDNKGKRLLMMNDGLEGPWASKVGEVRREVAGLEAEYAKLEAQLKKIRNPEPSAVVTPDMPRVGGFVEGENSGGDAKAEAAAAKDQERLRAQFERLQVSMMGEKDALAFHLEEKQMLIDGAFFAGEASHLERNEATIQLEAEHQAALTKLTQEEAKKRADAEKAADTLIFNTKMGIAQQTLGLVRAFAGDNKALAMAGIALEKAMAIVSIKVSNEVAAQAAMAHATVAGGPIAGEIAYAKMKTLGAISMGLVTATGLAQMSQVGDDGAAAGSPGNPISTTSSSSYTDSSSMPLNSATTTPEAQSGTTHIYLSTSNLIDEAGLERLVDDRIVPIIRDGVDNRDVILISGSSRNASELTQA